MPWNPLIDHFKTYQSSLRTGSFLFFQNNLARKVLIEFGNPSKTRFNGRSSVINIISIKAKSHFQSKSISRPETYRLNSLRSAGAKNRIPYFFRIPVLVFKINFYTACAGITRCANQYISNGSEFTFHKSVILQIQNIHVCQSLQDPGSV